MLFAGQNKALAGDFFSVPDQVVVPKPPVVPISPTPSLPPNPGNSVPSPVDAAAPLSPIESTPLRDFSSHSTYRVTSEVGGANPEAAPFAEVGADRGVLIGFVYSLNSASDGKNFVQTLQPVFVRSLGKQHGSIHGKLVPGHPGTMLEARPGYVMLEVIASGEKMLDGFQVVFARYEQGRLDPSDHYSSAWIGGKCDGPLKRLSGEGRPIAGISGKASAQIWSLALLVEKNGATFANPVVARLGDHPFGTAAPPGAPEIPMNEPAPQSGDTAPAPSPSAPIAALTPEPVAPKPKAPPSPDECELWTCAAGNFEIFIGGKSVLQGQGRRPKHAKLELHRGDVLSAVVDAGSDESWFSLSAIRGHEPLLDAGAMTYSLDEPPGFKTTKLLNNSKRPKAWIHENLRLGDDARPVAVWAAFKESGASRIYLKAVVP